MSPQLYATLRERIVKVVPEIMELKFGCKVMLKNEDAMFFSDTGNSNLIVLTESDRLNHVHHVNEILKILGRDIQLADVLRAISESEKFSSNSRDS